MLSMIIHVLNSAHGL